MDSSVNPKMKTVEGERVGARSLARNISGIEGCARAPGWGLKRLTGKSITHTNQTTS